MNLKIYIYYLVPFLLFFFPGKVSAQNVIEPSVKIKDHKGNKDIINITCDYNFLPSKGVGLTAEYPDIRETNSYSVSSINYQPLVSFDEGDVVEIKRADGKEDDTFSAEITLPFDFCFYGNKYQKIIISDNGIVSFTTALANGEAPFAPATPLPNGLPKNSIFGVFHDMLNTKKEVRYKVEGIMPYRRVIINYNNLPQYAYAEPGKASTSQIVLYETTNVIDVYVKDRFENKSTNEIFNGDGAYRKNAILGITNYDSSQGVVAPGRDTGNWEAHNEAWRFLPNGSSNITIKWKYENGSEVAGTRNQPTITVYPAGDIKYTVEVTYNFCTLKSVEDQIEIKFSQEFPTAKDITTEAFCVNNGESYTLDVTQYQSQINIDNTLTFSYYEDLALTQPISAPTAYTFLSDKTIYVKVLKSGECYIISKINLKLNKRPVVTPDQTFEVCDVDNNEKEVVNLNSLRFTGLTGTKYKFFETLAEAQAGTPEITNYTNYGIDVSLEPSGTKTLYLRIWNSALNDPDCYTIVPFKVKLNKYIVLEPLLEPLVCYVTKGQKVENFDLTQYESGFILFPISGVPLTFEYRDKYNRLISNPSSATIIMDDLIYVKVTATGYCSATATLQPTADDDCNGAPGGGGGGGFLPGQGGGALCDVPLPITVELHKDYLKYYLALQSLTLADITIEGFYDTNSGVLIKNTVPYDYTITPPESRLIQARYTINSTGIKVFFNFRVTASSKPNIAPDTFDICDIYNDKKENVSLVPKYRDIINTQYRGFAQIYFFSSSSDRADFINSGYTLNNHINTISAVPPDPAPTTAYVLINFFDCIYETEIYFYLKEIVIEPIPLQVCDFNSDNKERVDLSKKAEGLIKNSLTPDQITKLESIKYYTSLNSAHQGGNNYIQDPTQHEISAPSQMSIFARVEITDECYKIVEVIFNFETAVALPTILENVDLCDNGNDNQEYYNLNNSILSKDPGSEISFYRTKETAEVGDETSGFFIPPSEMLNYEVTVSLATIYIRVYDTTTKCAKVISTTITLIKYPEINNNLIEHCDYLNDGKEEIGVEAIRIQLIKNNSAVLLPSPAMAYKFYKTEADAKAETDEITIIEATNTNSIWVRVIRNVGDCPLLFELKFSLIPPPEVFVKDLVYTICNNNTANENGEIKERVVLDNYKNDVLGYPFTNNHIFTYYDTSEADAVSGTAAGQVSSNYDITSFSKTIWVRVTYTPTGCFSIKPIVFEQTTSLENDITNTEIVQCATGEMSKIVNLTEYPPRMVVAPAQLSDFNVSYHTSRSNAVNSIEITSDILNYYVTPASQIWVKFVDKRPGSLGCYIIKKIDVTIYSSPKVQDIFPFVCDEEDGQLNGSYILPNLDIYKQEIMPGESITTINSLFIYTYYKSLQDAQNMQSAQNGTNFTFLENELEIPTDPTDPKYYRVWVRIDKNDATGCYSVVAITFNVAPKVAISPQVPKLVECDGSDNDGKSTFDLTTVSGQLSSTSGASFIYYPTEADAQNNTQEITTPTAWQIATAYSHTVYVRVQALGYCDNLAKIELTVYPYIQAADYSTEVCELESDGTTEVTVNLLKEVNAMTGSINTALYPDLLSDLDISFYENSADSQNQTGSIPASKLPAYNIAVGITEVYVRFQSKTTPCYEIKKLSLTKIAAPVIADVSYLLCDDNLDDKYEISLTVLDPLLVAPTSYTLNYYESLAEAQTDTQPIDKTVIYEIPVSSFPKTLGVRVTDNATGCVKVKTLTLTTNPKVAISPQVPKLVECDGSDNDGKSIFDLTAVSGQLSSTTGASFIYYPTEADAQNNTQEITTPTAWQIATAYSHTVYVRVTAPNHCDNLAKIELTVYPYIQAADYSTEVCELESDGTTEVTVNLLKEVNAMTGSINTALYPDLLSDLDISFYENSADSQNQTGSIPASKLPAYNIAVGITEVYVRFQSKTTPCYEIKKLSLTKIAAPVIADVSYLLCDDNLDDKYEISLTVLDPLLVAPTSYTLNYYESLAEAQTDTQPIDKTVIYEIPVSSFPKTLGVRVTDNATGCVKVKTLIITTNPKAAISPQVPKLVECDGSDNDGKSIFDLTTVSGQLSSTLGASFSYYPTEADAQNNTQEITTPTAWQIATAYSHTVYVRVTAPNHCDNLAKIELTVYPYIQAADYSTEVCELESDGTTEVTVNLLKEVNAMTGSINTALYPDLLSDLDISFYENSADSQNQTGTIPSSNLPAYNIAVGITEVYVRFQSKTTPCYEIKKLSLTKIAAPVIADVSYLLCDDNLDDKYEISLTVLDPLLVAPTSYTLNYYESLAEAQTDTQPIDKTVIYEIPVSSFPKTLGVRVTDNATGCVKVKTLTITTNPKVPVSPQVPSIVECDGSDNDGKSIFDLTAVSGQLSSTTGASFIYYPTEADAQNNTQEITTPTAWQTATSYSHTVYVRVTAPNHCDNLAKIELTVYPYIDVDNYSVEVCEFNEGGEPEKVDLTLLVQNMNVRIDSNPLYPKLSSEIEIKYYESQQNAQGQTNWVGSASNPNSITNYLPPVGVTTLWVRFQSTTSNCYEIRTLILNKIKAPESKPVSYVLCDSDMNGKFDDEFLNNLDNLVITNAAQYTISYHISKPDALSGINEIDKNTYVEIDIRKTYYVRVQDKTTGCISVNKVSFITNPVLYISDQELVACDSDNKGFAYFNLNLIKDKYTAKSNLTIRFYRTEKEAKNAMKDVVDTSIKEPELSNYLNVQQKEDYVYVRVDDDEGLYCPSVAKVKLIAYHPPRVLPQEVYICPRTQTVLDAGNFDEYIWSTGETTRTITVDKVGVYTVTVKVTDLNYGISCSAIFSVVVKELEEPVILDLKEGKDYVTVVAKGPAPLEYSMDNVNWQKANVFYNLQPGIYTFYVRSVANGCEALTSKGIIFALNNVITPNGDGYNDIWRMCGLNLFKGEKSHIKIFDRYGKEVFEEYSNDCFIWNGKHLGRVLPTTSYWYVITIADGRQFTGWIMLRNYDENFR